MTFPINMLDRMLAPEQLAARIVLTMEGKMQTQ
jgi:hypothetical protein